MEEPATLAGHRLRFSAASGCGLPKKCLASAQEWRDNPDTEIAKAVAAARKDQNNPLTIFTDIKAKCKHLKYPTTSTGPSR